MVVLRVLRVVLAHQALLERLELLAPPELEPQQAAQVILEPQELQAIPELQAAQALQVMLEP